LFSTLEELEEFIESEENYSLVADDLPLIYNLNIVENIAIIKEVHEDMKALKAESLAMDALSLLSLEYIGLKRLNECTIMDIFYVMVIRASMSDDEKIFIKMPSSLLGNLKKIHLALEKLSLLQLDKDIYILDTQDNKNFYKGSLCNIIE